MEDLSPLYVRFDTQTDSVVDYTLDVQPQLGDVTDIYYMGFHLEMAATPAPSSIRLQIDSSIGDLKPLYYAHATSTKTPTANTRGSVLIYPNIQSQSQDVSLNYPWHVVHTPQGNIQRLQIRVGDEDMQQITFFRLVVYFGCKLGRNSSRYKPIRPGDYRFSAGYISHS
jgi:hypothetical protein